MPKICCVWVWVYECVFYHVNIESISSNCLLVDAFFILIFSFRWIAYKFTDDMVRRTDDGKCNFFYWAMLFHWLRRCIVTADRFGLFVRLFWFIWNERRRQQIWKSKLSTCLIRQWFGPNIEKKFCQFYMEIGPRRWNSTSAGPICSKYYLCANIIKHKYQRKVHTRKCRPILGVAKREHRACSRLFGRAHPVFRSAIQSMQLEHADHRRMLFLLIVSLPFNGDQYAIIAIAYTASHSNLKRCRLKLLNSDRYADTLHTEHLIN